jgi:hypothetical protein
MHKACVANRVSVHKGLTLYTISLLGSLLHRRRCRLHLLDRCLLHLLDRCLLHRHLLDRCHHLVGVTLVVADGVQLDGTVSKGATITPRARPALPVHAHLGLALGLVNANAATTRAEAATTAATRTWGAVSNVLGDLALHLRRLPVGGLGVVVDVVHLSGRRVRHLPTRGQVRLVCCKISTALHLLKSDLLSLRRLELL